LNAATSLVALEDTWNEPLGEYATFQAVVLEADTSGSLVNADYSSSTGELVNQLIGKYLRLGEMVTIAMLKQPIMNILLNQIATGMVCKVEKLV